VLQRRLHGPRHSASEQRVQADLGSTPAMMKHAIAFGISASATTVNFPPPNPIRQTEIVLFAAGPTLRGHRIGGAGDPD
jgi:hypothetical protein